MSIKMLTNVTSVRIGSNHEHNDDTITLILDHRDETATIQIADEDNTASIWLDAQALKELRDELNRIDL